MITIKDIKKTTYSYIELEDWLEKNKKIEASIDELFDFFSKKFSVEDIIYLMDAYRMPKKEIEYYLNLYRRNKSNYDEKDFIYNLAKLYKTDEKTIIRRIEEIITIEIEEKERNNPKNIKKRRK